MRNKMTQACNLNKNITPAAMHMLQSSGRHCAMQELHENSAKICQHKLNLRPASQNEIGYAMMLHFDGIPVQQTRRDKDKH